MPIAVNTDCDLYLPDWLQLLEQQLATINCLALANDLSDAIITDLRLKITSLDTVVPEAAQWLIDQTGRLLPRSKITELLMDVDDLIDYVAW